jgi:hypothetical protein
VDEFEMFVCNICRVSSKALLDAFASYPLNVRTTGEGDGSDESMRTRFAGNTALSVGVLLFSLPLQVK